MTEKPPVKEAGSVSKSEGLSTDDLQYLMGLLDKAEEELEAEGDGENKRDSTLSTRKRIIRIKLAIGDLCK